MAAREAEEWARWATLGSYRPICSNRGTTHPVVLLSLHLVQYAKSQDFADERATGRLR